MTRHCPECGALVPLDSAPFCLSCGRGLPSGQAAGTTGPADPDRTVKLPVPADQERTVKLPAPPESERTTKLAVPGHAERPAGGRYAADETGQQERYAPPETGQQERYAPPGENVASSPLEEIFARGSAGQRAGRAATAGRRVPQQAESPATGRLGFGAIAGLAAMAFLLVVGIGIFVVRTSDLGGAASRAPVAASRSPRAVSSSTPRAELAQMGAVIDLSAVARNTVVSATDEVTGCSVAPPAAIVRIREAVSRRRTAVDRLAALDVTAIPSGQLMRDYLRRALRLSILADDDFIAWMEGLGPGGQCPVSTSESSYLAGARASDEATAVKEKFVALWNPLAARLGQPTFGPTQI